jgi:molybdopterin synthase sulfur carrier subunit
VARVKLFARARELAGRADDTIDGATLGAVLDAAVARYGAEFAELLAHSRVWVNGDEAPDGRITPIAAGDEVAVLPPVSGG